jgi:hypothetical protein
MFHYLRLTLKRWSNKLSLARRLKRLSAGWILVLVVLLGAGVTWLIIYQFGGEVMDRAPLTEMQWSRMEALATVIALAFGVGAGLFVLIELIQNSDGRNLDIYRDIYEKFMDTDQVESRRFIYTELYDGDYTGDFARLRRMSAADLKRDYRDLLVKVYRDAGAKRHVKNVLNAIDYFGFLAAQDWVTADELIGWVSPIVVKVWQKIGPLVEYECRVRADEEPDYYEAARNLALWCQRWRKRNLPANLKTTEYTDRRL